MKSIRKAIIVIALTAALVLALTACAEVEAFFGALGGSARLKDMPFSHLLVQKGHLLTGQMISKADRDFVALRSPAAEEILAYVSHYTALEGEEPDRAVILSFEDSALDNITELFSEEADVRLNSELREIVRNEILPTIAFQLNARVGDMNMAAMSVLTQGRSFLEPQDESFTGHALVVLMYEVHDGDDVGTALSFASFSSSDEGAMSGSSQFVTDGDGTLSEMLYDDEEDIWDNLRGAVEEMMTGADFPSEGITCEVIEGDELRDIINPE